jgi:hypothetical protein
MNYTAMMTVALGLALVGGLEGAESRVGVQTKGEQEYMFVGGEGKKAWYSALELEQIARAYAASQKLDFDVATAEKSVWVHTDGGKVLAEVWFSSGAGRPSLQVQIGRKGSVLKHKIEVTPSPQH